MDEIDLKLYIFNNPKSMLAWAYRMGLKDKTKDYNYLLTDYRFNEKGDLIKINKEGV